MTNPAAAQTTSKPAPATESPDGVHPITVEVMVRLQAIAIPEPGGG
jgi:hypothetical protein